MTWLRCNNYAEGSIAHQYQLAFREDMVSKRSKERHKMLKVWWHIHLANYIGGKEKSSSGNKRFDYGKSNICGQSTRQFQTFFPQHSYRNEMFIEGFFFCFRDHVLRDRRGEMRKLTDVELLKYTHWWGLQLKERDSLKKDKKDCRRWRDGNGARQHLNPLCITWNDDVTCKINYGNWRPGNSVGYFFILISI